MKTIYQIVPVDKKVKDYIEDNVVTEAWQWLGGSLCIGHRYIDDVVNILIGAGFDIGVDFLVN